VARSELVYLIWQDGNDIIANSSNMYRTDRHLVAVLVSLALIESKVEEVQFVVFFKQILNCVVVHHCIAFS
jgi:hypothetical protein